MSQRTGAFRHAVRRTLEHLVDRFIEAWRNLRPHWRTAREKRKKERREWKEQYSAAMGPPAGWSGYWSARYAAFVARTLELTLPFGVPQNRLIAGTPRPLHEALDPAASMAELIDRNGNRVFRLSDFVILDLLGPHGLILGALVLTVAAFTVAAPRLGLPPLTAPVEAPKQGGETRSPPQQQQQQPQQQQRQPINPPAK